MVITRIHICIYKGIFYVLKYLYWIENCIADLKKLLGKNLLSAVIDGAGGPLYNAYPKVMRTGGIIANYGQTASVKGVGYSMAHVLKNIDIRGSTMGSRQEFRDMVKFVDENKIKPIVSHVWFGLTSDSIDQSIAMMRYIYYLPFNVLFY